MNPSFDLIDRPWLPCAAPDGQPRELGLREALARAHELRELRDQSPLVTAALHRLLLAVLHRVFGPSDDSEWARLWEDGSFSGERLDAYFSKWKGRFDLLDADRPFYQRADFATPSPSGVNRLAQELARGNNPTLFDHTDDLDAPPASPAAVARYVVAEQAFAVGGGKSVTGNTTHAPLVAGAATFPQGESLWQTLLLNMVVYNGEDRPFPALHDVPWWERDEAGKAALEAFSPQPAGYLDLLTWQSRTLRLHAECDDGETTIRRVSYAQGRRFSPRPGFQDPAFSIRRDEKIGDRPIRFAEHRALWRDSAALIQFSDAAQFRGPLSFHELADRTLPSRSRAEFSQAAVIGLCTDKAKVNFWRDERLPLSPAYLGDDGLVADLKTALSLAEEVAGVLRGAVRAAARIELSPAQPAGAHKDRVSRIVDSLAPERNYWPRLEAPFRRLLIDMPGTAVYRLKLLGAWYERVLWPTARESLRRSANALRSSGRADRGERAAVAADEAFARGLWFLKRKNEFQHLFRRSEQQEAAHDSTRT